MKDYITLKELRKLSCDAYSELRTLTEYAIETKDSGDLKKYKSIMGSVKFQRGKCAMLDELIETLEEEKYDK